MPSRKWTIITALAVVCAVDAPDTPAEDKALPAPSTLVVIVHPDNELPDPTLKELRSYLLLERQFWPNGGRIVLLRRPSSGAEEETLLRRVYSMSKEALRKYWVNRLFAGEIPAIPTVIRSGKAAAEAVKKDKRAISVVLASELPDGVRILTIDGKGPVDKDYPLTIQETP